MGCHALLQRTFLIWGSNPPPMCLLRCQEDSLPLSHLGSCRNWDSLKLPYTMWKCYSFSRVWLFFDHMDCSLPGSSVHGIFQARILEWVAISFSRRSSWLRIEWWSSALQADFLLSEPPGKPVNKNSLLILMVVIPLYSLCHLEPNSVFPRKKKMNWEVTRINEDKGDTN